MNEKFNVEKFSYTADVRISQDEMKAFLKLAAPSEGYTYTKDEIYHILAENGVKFGIIDQNIEALLANERYGQEVTVAIGQEPGQSKAGYYDFKFNKEPITKPTINADGSVNYWSMSLVENVMEGQVIAKYHPARSGESGISVTGRKLPSKIPKDKPFLKGKGFTRLEDKLTYIASIDGKIEYMDGRVHITHVYEVFHNIDYTNGRIDFKGDVIIHGSVCAGAVIQAMGSITVDGNVEAAQLIAKKDIILRSGVQGDGKTLIKSGGNIYAKFVEASIVEAKGSITANVLMNSEVSAGDSITLHGKCATIVGGRTYAVKRIEVMNAGNVSEKKTYIAVGINDEAIIKIRELSERIGQTKQKVEELNSEIADIGDEPKEQSHRIALLRDKIKSTSQLSEWHADLSNLLERAEGAKGAYIAIGNTTYPGVVIQLNSSKLHVRECKNSVKYKLRGLDVVMYHLIADIRSRN